MNEVPVPQPRRIRFLNWRGLLALTAKEIHRFLKIYLQTIVAPVAGSLVFFLIFSIAMKTGSEKVTITPYETAVSYMSFLVPGLVIMAMAQNAFMNASASLVLSKIQGNIVDILMPPLSPFELTLGYMLGGMVRGLVVATATLGALALFTDISIYDPRCVAFFGLSGSMFLSLLGLIGGIWAKEFDQIAAVQNFVIMPASFLSGAFYTSDQLSESWRLLVHLNPFFYIIDGFRYGFIGIADSVLAIGVVVMVAINLFAFVIAYRMLASGYSLKS